MAKLKPKTKSPAPVKSLPHAGTLTHEPETGTWDREPTRLDVMRTHQEHEHCCELVRAARDIVTCSTVERNCDVYRSACAFLCGRFGDHTSHTSTPTRLPEEEAGQPTPEAADAPVA